MPAGRRRYEKPALAANSGFIGSFGAGRGAVDFSFRMAPVRLQDNLGQNWIVRLPRIGA